MGRSKFPGKPSKSINRKRISVLQLDPNSAATETSASAAATAHHNSSSSVTATGPATANTTQTNASSSSSAAAAVDASSSAPSSTATEDEEAKQAKTEEENVEDQEAKLRAADKHKNGKREDDDDDEDDDHVRPASMTTNGHNGGGGHAGSTGVGGGSRTTTSSSQQQQQQQQTNNNSHAQQHSNHSVVASSKSPQNFINSKIPKPTLSAKVEASPAVAAATNSHRTLNKIHHNKPEKRDKLLSREEVEDELCEETAKDTSRRALQNVSASTSLSASSLATSTSASSQLKFPQRNCKKFKNLNINKPEVMLPSSTKLKLQQQQHQQNPEKSLPTPASQQSHKPAESATVFVAEATVTNSKGEDESAEPVINKQQQQQPQICEMSSSKTTASDPTPTTTAIKTTSSSAASPSSISRFNNTKQHDDDDEDDAAAVADHHTPTTHKITEDDDDHQHRQLEDRLNDAANIDNEEADDSFSANTTTTQHAPVEDDDDADADEVDENSSSHNDLKSSSKSCHPETELSSNTCTSELHSEKHDLQRNDECEEGLKHHTSSTTTATSTSPVNSVTMDTTTSASNGSTATNASSSSSSSSSSTNVDKKQKKTVTFKNVLETSDDKSAVKKFYNPDNRKPLISIIKKECLNRPLMYTRSSECIVRPSRLTEILKNNSNIDKLNALKFRSNCTNGVGGGGGGVLAGPLSRVFGAPCESEEDSKQNLISFRLTKHRSDAEDQDEDEEDNDDDDDDDEEEEEGEEEDEDEEDDDDDDDDGNAEVEDEGYNREEQQFNGEHKIISSNLESLNVIKANEKHLSAEATNKDEDQQIVIDKHFVLPKRSSRSSRVIKPNKRLVEDSVLSRSKSLKSSSLNSNSNLLASPMLVKEEKPSGGLSLQSNYFGLGDYKTKDCNGLNGKSSNTSNSLESGKPSAFAAATSNAFSTFGGNSLLNSSKSSSFILRQPRLQFESLSATIVSPTTAAGRASPNTASTTTASERNSSATVTAAAAAAFALSASLPKSLLQAISSSSTSTSAGAAAAASVNANTGTPSSTLGAAATTATGAATTAAVTAASMLSPITFSLNGTSALKNNVNTPPASSSLSPSSILCVVCSSTIHTKNLPQASKYGQLSCEYCRKFISKIAKKSLAIKNSTNNKPIITQCKADGNCVIMPLNKGIHIKNFKKLYKERCGLCWLKKCLQTLQLPKVRLNALLPVLNAVIGNSKSNQIDSKIRKDLETSMEATKLSIRWKPTRESTPPATTTMTTSASADGLKMNLKTNSLSENAITFGATPLLRPAILEKSSFMKPATVVVETKQEILEKPEKKPLEILKDVKVEVGTSDISATTTKAKRKDKCLDKERREVKIKELPSPKHEEKLRDTKEHIEKTELIEPENLENVNNSPDDTNTCSNDIATSTATSTTSITTQAAVVNATGNATATAADKRQRIDLKGPRVKHVCRSASIVLGQPLAMFGEDEEDSALTSEGLQQNLAVENGDVGTVKPSLTDENDNCASCKTQQPLEDPNICEQQPPLKVAKIETTNTTANSNSISTTSTTTTATSSRTSILTPATTTKLSQRPHHYNTQLTAYKKQFSSQMVASSASSSLLTHRRKDAQVKCKLLISIDFWENYDPAEVCQTGFGLIVTETVAQRALCFLCGSAGQEPLIFCACCCEPYHQYCVQDEFNLKHGSLDDTLLLNDSCLSISGLNSSNTAIAKLNWLCPRCTVCYTCNMSSGAKVKCQKCQKNYHSTCLGTSKRLLGADRPLICVNCLKCRSCSTTKVTKFVGNLPMCTSCFKLRKKGNYCPVCQKCYDDQDFDLKMMECGDCHQWVHAKCETLTDEQYNLLSTLPESIEFICKRCSRKSVEAKERASEWREAVREEFQSNLMSVLKLLSKSRQACSLLRLSPRKQMKCSCGGGSQGGAGSSNGTSSGSSSKYQPKSLQFNQEQSSTTNGQSSSSASMNIDVYEFDDQEKDTEMTTQPLMALEKKCVCQTNASNSSGSNLSLVEIKQKIANDSYGSLAEFHYDMSLVIQQANCDELVIVYKELLSEQFPWFQNETQACTDALEEDMYESAGGAYGLNTSLDTESDYQMDCMPTAADQHEEAQRSALLAELPQDLEEQMYNIKTRPDARICLFCRRSGEGLTNEEARLLYCGHDCWVHTNCALWSAEVFEEIDGSLQNVHSAVSRGRMIKCSVCGNRGATVGCNVKSCGEHYHYPCARAKNCAFLADKSMYCPNHAPSANNSKISFETQFEVLRPVYVELERKRKKLVEPSKVQFHIGSLEVKQLGHVIPRFSDTYEAVVPVNFLCSRLYWSSKEPWKIVEYTVRTYIHNSSSSTLNGSCVDFGKNFTVDHTQTNTSLIHLGLSQIQQWHMSLARGEYDPMEEYDYLSNFTQPQAVSMSGTAAGHEPSSATNDEEPQTNADLLPPEIKEAIFEDLPGDLLEGISMLDIFTKCMNYEDMAQGEQAPLTDEDTMTSIGAFTKQLTAELNNGWPNTSVSSANMTEDSALFSTSQAMKLQKLKKSSSPVISCDVSAKNAIKRRKLSENMLISLNQHQRTQKKDSVAAAATSRRLDLETTTKRSFTWSAEKRYNIDANAHSTTVGQTESKLRIMQVDGVDDSITEFRFITQDSAAQAMVKCERCQCTYRNIESFQRHMSTCEPHASASANDSETEHNTHGNATEVNTNSITLEQLQELNNKIQQQHHQQQQQQQQRTTAQLPFLQAIPTQTLTQLQGLQTLPLQLQQGVQNLQNLQNLQQLQQLTQAAQPLGGNFFISTAQPEVSNATPDLQLYANALQGLTQNLNGTFTLQPTGNTFTTTPQMTQNHPQPQLLALSTNADGTQQIIQLPAQTSAPASAATYQTLHATNSDKKIILPVGGGKPMKTMATKAAQQAAAKNKLKATTAVKPIQSKINVATTATHQIPPQAQTVNATQLLNQQLLQQLQAQAQAQQNSNTAPQIVFQQTTTATQPQTQPQIIMQQSQPQQNIISFVTTTNDGSQQPQFQYVTLPTGQTTAHEYKPQTHASTLFTTTANAHQPLMQSAYLQTDASGNLVLTNAPQATTPLQLLTASQPSQVIGTLIQPQTIQLQGGNVLTTTGADGGLPQTGSTQTQQQVIISGPGGPTHSGLEMLTSANGTPQVILATNNPPMYYGLETIVQNTVMSSQQFVSTAMPGVLSQNASFSATTTQVFQASKIEPLVDIPAGYVLLNNVDANNTAAALLQQQQPQQQQQSAQATNAANQASFIQAALQQQAAAAAAASMAEQQQQQQQQQQHQHQQQQQQQNVYRIQTPPVSQGQTFQLQPQIVVTPTPQNQQQNVVHQQSATATQYVDHNTGTVYSAKVTPVAQVKRTKAATPVATVTKVQPQQVVVNKVMPNVAQVTVQQHHTPSATANSQPQKLKQNLHQNQGSKNNIQIASTMPQQQQQQQLVNNAAVATTKQQINETATVTTTNNNNNNKKTNMIRPLNKAEVKPKVMKTAAATVVTKPNNNNANNNNSNQHSMVNNTNTIMNNNNNTTTIGNHNSNMINQQQLNNNSNKMIILKPHQQQQQQQQNQAINQPPTMMPMHNVVDDLETRLNHQQIQESTETTNSSSSNNNSIAMNHNNLSENTINNEFINLQHHHQHFNVADALLIDENNSTTMTTTQQQPLTHCSYSSTVAHSGSNSSNSYETNQQQQQTTISDNVNHILPTIQRMPQYTNINIVNPLQQYTSTSSSTSTSSTSSTTAATTVTRPTNRVLPMQQKTTYEQNNHHSSNNFTTNSSSIISSNQSSAVSNSTAAYCNSTTTTTTTTTLNSQISQQQNENISGHLNTEEETSSLMKSHNLNKIAYEAEVKQMLLHSPNPQNDVAAAAQHLQQQQQQQQHVMFMQHQLQSNLTVQPKGSPPPPLTSFELHEKVVEDAQKICYMNHQMSNYGEETNATATALNNEECLITDPKFPTDSEVILGSDCSLENDEEAALVSSVVAEDNDGGTGGGGGVDDDDEEDDDDGFSLKMPSTNCSDNLSMDSDEPAVKEKISKILDNLTNEDCNDSINTNATSIESPAQNQCLTTTASTSNNSAQALEESLSYLQNSQQTTNEPQLSVDNNGEELYNASPEETTALIADVELAVENIKEKLQEKLQTQIVDPLAEEYHIENCPSTAELMEQHHDPLSSHEHEHQQHITLAPTNPAAPAPPPQPPTRAPKRLSGPHLLYEIQSEDGFTYKSTSIAEVWEKVFEAVQVARRANGLAPLPEGPLADMSGVQMIGLKTNALKYLIEQLPGVEKCSKYTPKYHKRNFGSYNSQALTGNSSGSGSGSTTSTSNLSGNSSGAPTSLDIDGNTIDYASDQEELQENPYDCARCEPYSKRSEYDMFSWLASRHRKQPVQVFVQPSDNELVPRRGTGSNLPMAMKYRTLKETYKDYVGVFRSHIHGRGLYCTKDIEAGEMVIEYAGELIRSTLTDQRERYYNSRGIGCYMFKIDDNLVVDATMRGNAARFINHSCEPNCYSKVVDILGHKHIIIFALRRIVQGEELTYDYKFPFEDEKIPCSCGSKRCRKYLN